MRTGPGTVKQTLFSLVVRPKVFFRTMRVGVSNTTARRFMLGVLSFIGISWLVVFQSRVMAALTHAIILIASLYLLTYIEAVGVVFFSRKRRWRVPFRLAERLVCYASIGWIPTAWVMGLAWVLYRGSDINRWMYQLLGVWGPWQSVELLILIGAVSMMWFEVLVWVGVRQTKYANSHAMGTAEPPQREPTGTP